VKPESWVPGSRRAVRSEGSRAHAGRTPRTFESEGRSCALPPRGAIGVWRLPSPGDPGGVLAAQPRGQVLPWRGCFRRRGGAEWRIGVAPSFLRPGRTGTPASACRRWLLPDTEGRVAAILCLLRGWSNYFRRSPVPGHTGAWIGALAVGSVSRFGPNTRCGARQLRVSAMAPRTRQCAFQRPRVNPCPQAGGVRPSSLKPRKQRTDPDGSEVVPYFSDR
jgi:hypothetical protein